MANMGYDKKRSVELYDMLTLVFLIQELSARQKRLISYKDLHSVKLSLKKLYLGANTSQGETTDIHISANDDDNAKSTMSETSSIHEVQKNE